MKKILALVSFCLILCIVSTYGQGEGTDQMAQKEIKKLAFLVGDWEGSGWIRMQDGNLRNFEQTERVQFKLDSTIVLIEGQGRAHGQIYHDALAIVSYNHSDKNYSFTSFLNTGRSGKYKAELIEDKLFWYPGDNMRYIIYINDEGQWYESGEYNTGGDNWFQFFEMTLDKL
jgi:hypothetical protein